MLDIRRNYKRDGQVLAGGVMERTLFTSKLMAGAVGMLLLLSTLTACAPGRFSSATSTQPDNPFLTGYLQSPQERDQLFPLIRL